MGPVCRNIQETGVVLAIYDWASHSNLFAHQLPYLHCGVSLSRWEGLSDKDYKSR